MTQPNHPAPAEGIGAEDFRYTLGRFASGVTVITARTTDGSVHGMTASAFVSVSMNPPLILISVDRRARMHDILLADDVEQFSVNLLAQSQAHLSNHFAGRPGPEEDVPWREQAGFPVLGGTVASVVCRKYQVMDGGDHTLFLGLITSTEYSDEAPLLYFKGKYGALAAEQ
ncbi:flavin reductase family protein [Deinococcus radiophilus]|uniref:Flavin reductase n=1 Tax=Deinococcus radiophilus TaxID=32062 RepID=A0A431W4A9_9DEIO|nr:flavin reductase family protein [Deinococcus radiophilus]RTR30234.1 flavin reductase [Deinococcus radiophilus]UFA49974.1 flavin reductase family protein [Deinococcus radiophilus]